MNRPLLVQRFVPARESTTSDSQVGVGSDTAEMVNLSAIIRNNIVVFDAPIVLASETVGIPNEENTE
jgi:hypothetical protein